MPGTTATLTTQQLPVFTATAEQFASLIELIALAQRSAIEVEMKLIRNLCGRKRISLKLLDSVQLILDKYKVAVLSGSLKRRQHEVVTLLPASAISYSEAHDTQEAATPSASEATRAAQVSAPRPTLQGSATSPIRRSWWRRIWSSVSLFAFALGLAAIDVLAWPRPSQNASTWPDRGTRYPSESLSSTFVAGSPSLSVPRRTSASSTCCFVQGQRTDPRSDRAALEGLGVRRLGLEIPTKGDRASVELETPARTVLALGEHSDNARRKIHKGADRTPLRTSFRRFGRE